MKKHVLFLASKRIYFRPLSLEDVAIFTKYANDPEVRTFLLNTFPKSALAEEAWLRRKMEDDAHDILFVVVLKKGHKLLGMTGLHKIDYINGTATTGTMLGAKEEWHKGYATESKKLLLEYAFTTLNLRKVCSAAFADNKASIKHNLTCGYHVEGVRKAQFNRGGKYHDEVLLAIFKEQWEMIR